MADIARADTAADAGRTEPSARVQLAIADVLPLVVAIGLAIATWVTIDNPNLRFGIVSPQLDGLINEAATLIAFGAAGLAWLRHRYMHDPSALYETAAFILFALLAAVQLLASLGIAAGPLGLDISNPGQAPLYAWAVIRVIAAALLVRAAWLRLHPRPTRGAAVVILVPAAIAAASSALLYAFQEYLPPALGSDAIAGLRVPSEVLGVLPGVALIEVALQLAAIALFALASVVYTRAARLAAAPAARYLSVGAIFAAFSQIHFVLFPGAYAGIVSTSDLLRVAFYVTVVFGIQAESGSTLRRLRAANRKLDALRDSEVARASMSERARLAREVHDGLAQDLWVAKLATERLGKAKTMDDVRSVQAELEDVIESSIAEARETVVALREAGNAGAPLAEALSRYAQRFGGQTGLDMRLHVEPIEPGVISASAAGELLRIAQEAMSNVRKHADATVVEVHLERLDDRVRLTVRDNGIGFDTAAQSTGYGLVSMRERSEIAGGRSAIESGPQSGTTVTVEIPIH
jgi:signal transduction histidine kinase